MCLDLYGYSQLSNDAYAYVTFLCQWQQAVTAKDCFKNSDAFFFFFFNLRFFYPSEN